MRAAKPDNTDSSLARAKQVFTQIRSHKYSAAPRTYEILYRYASGSNPALKRAVDSARRRTDKLEPADIDTLAGEFLLGALVDRSAEIGGLLSDELKQLLSSLELAHIETSDRAQKLSELAQTSGSTEVDQLHALIQTLLIGAKEMEESNKKLEAELSASMTEIKHLKTNLQKARADSMVDPLTMLKNRKSFDDSLTQVLKRAFPANIPVCLMMIDIDHFKTVNDRFGHLIGDQVIRMIASVLKSLLGNQTDLARYGGEEFVALRSSCNAEAGLKAAEEVRRQIAERPFRLRTSGEMIGSVSVSIGVASLKSTDTAQSFVERADQCLYFAKQNGRNRTASEFDLPDAATLQTM
jgi:diguanylate cyclase